MQDEQQQNKRWRRRKEKKQHLTNPLKSTIIKPVSKHFRSFSLFLLLLLAPPPPPPSHPPAVESCSSTSCSCSCSSSERYNTKTGEKVDIYFSMSPLPLTHPDQFSCMESKANSAVPLLYPFVFPTTPTAPVRREDDDDEEQLATPSLLSSATLKEVQNWCVQGAV